LQNHRTLYIPQVNEKESEVIMRSVLILGIIFYSTLSFVSRSQATSNDEAEFKAMVTCGAIATKLATGPMAKICNLELAMLGSYQDEQAMKRSQECMDGFVKVCTETILEEADSQ
jgi:hypothetical protein